MGRELMRRGIAADFFYYGMEGLTQDQASAMRAFWNRFKFMKSLPHGQPSLPSAWGLDDWCPDELCRQVEAAVTLKRYDAVIVNYVWMSRVLEGLRGPLKIIDTHDLFGERQRVAEETGIEPRWFFTTAEEENRGFARADIVIGIQSDETRAIRDRFDGLSMTVGHPVEPRFLNRKPSTPPFFTFGYLGSANPFNVASIQALDAALGGISLPPWALAGSICKRRLTLRSQPANFGHVNDLAEFYDSVECVLNPMLGGTGLKIKTIEALAFGARVIGTRDAFAGLDREHPFHSLGSVAEMAEAMRDYVEYPSLRSELLKETYRLFARYMADVARAYDRLADVIRSGHLSADAA
jgi:Glycosyl transferases group 1